MEDEDCSVNLEVCLKEEKEVKKEGDVEVMLEEVVMHIGLEEEEMLETSPNQSPCKSAMEVKEEPASDRIKAQEAWSGEEEEEEEEEEKMEAKVKVRRKKIQKKVSKSFPCEKCGLVSSSSANHKKHMMTHTGEKPYKCRYCLKAFRQRHHLLDHWRIHSGERPYHCEVCNQDFVQKSSLNLHKKKHLGIKGFTCDVCDYSTYQKTHLIVHMRKHTGERPYKCEKCGQTFSSSTRLKYHRMIHTGERPYMCEQCGVLFREKVTLQAHMAVHLNVGPFACEECGQEFPRLAGLSLHRRVHTNKDSYLYVHDKEASKTFSTALQKASCNINPLKRKRAQESEKYLSSESVGESDTDEAGEGEEPVSKTHREMNETATYNSQQTLTTPTKAPITYMLSLSPEKRVVPRNKHSLYPDNTDQHKLKENLASSLNYSVENINSDVSPNQVREALERGTVLETHSDSGKGFFIVLPPALQNKDIMVLSDPCEVSETAAIHIPEASGTLHTRNTTPNLLSEGVVETDKVPYPSVEEEVQECDMNSIGMAEEVCSDGEGEIIHSCGADAVQCILNSDGPEELLGSCGRYSEAIEEQLHPDGASLLLWKDDGSKKFTRVTYIIEAGKKEPIIIEEEGCSPHLDDNSLEEKAKKRKRKGNETISKKSKKCITISESANDIKIDKKSKTTKVKTPRVYNCEQCGKTCKNSSNYVAHLRIHSGERPYFCDVCRVGFKQISHLRSHSRIHTGERPYVCDLCGASFTQPSRLSAHKKNLHPNGKVEIKEKKKKHVPENRIKNFFCQYCDRTFIGECLKIDHMKLHQSVFPFICKICGMQFKTKSSMVSHVVKHQDMKDSCELSDIDIPNIDRLQKNKVTQHDVNEPNSEVMNMYINVKIGEERDFVVLNPAMTGSKEDALATHIKTENCEDSDPGFYSVKQEIIHVTDVDGDVKSVIQEVTSTQDDDEVAVHDITNTSLEKLRNVATTKDSKPLMSQPSETSNFHNDSREIMREGKIKNKRFITYIDNIGKKMWMCKVCDRTFTQSSNLYCHMRLHTGDKPYRCNVCHEAFRQITHLKDHMRRHTGAKPHRCSVCGKCFTQRSAARRHIMVMHKGEGISERIPESQMAREVINTLANECGRPSRGARKAVCKRKSATGQDGEVQKLSQKEDLSHICKVCDRRFQRLTSLGAHSRRCGKHKYWKDLAPREQCKGCGESFVLQTQLTQHWKTCSALDDKSMIVETEKSSKSKRKITNKANCDQDSVNDDKESKDQLRTLNGNAEESFQCRECDKVMSSTVLLKAHMETHSGGLQQVCMQCGESFKRASALRYHQSMKHGKEDRRYKDYCSSGFLTIKKEYDDIDLEDMELHLDDSEPEDEKMDSKEDTDEEEEEINTTVALRQKERNNGTDEEKTEPGTLKTISNEVGKASKYGKDSCKTRENRRHVCVTCSAGFISPSKLNQHKAVCKGHQEPYNTHGRHQPLEENSPSKISKVSRDGESQGKGGRSKRNGKSSYLFSPASSHESSEWEGDGAVACSLVDSKDATEHSNQELYCEDCDKHFPDKCLYVEHLAMHEAARPFKCKHCSMRFKCKAHLFNHYRRHVSLAGVECL